MSVHVTNKKIIHEYLECKYLDQNKLKNLEFGIYEFLNRKEVDSRSVMIGNAVGTYLFGGGEHFGNKYHVSRPNNPYLTNRETSIIEYVFEHSEKRELNLTGNQDLLEKSYCAFQLSTALETSNKNT